MNRNDSDLSLNTRSRLLGSSDHETLIREGIIPSPKVNELSSNPRLKQLKNYFSNNIFLDDEWHSEEYLHIGYEELKTADSSWRLREKMRTVGVALVICLNIGIDPPDLFKPNPCAKKECWFDPTGQKQKGLEYIGNALQSQYEKWQAKAKYKQCLDPTSEDLRRICMNLRKGSRSDRLLFHYNGHGVPKPTKNGELWVFGKHYTHYTPVAICELRSWLGDPAIYVLDCSAAGLLIQHLVDNMTLKDSDLNASYDSEHPNLPTTPSNHHLRENNSNYSFISQAASDSATIVLAACKGNEQLPFHPMYPVDIFTSCLTTPTTIAIRWFILQNPYSMHGVNPDLAESIPGKDNDRKTPRGELNWILTAITDTIAWNTLPASCFKKMFRKDLLVASLFRNFLLAKRIMKSFGCTPQSWPPMPDTTTHSLWQSWDMALESFLTHYVSLQRGSSMVDYRNNMPFTMPTNISFFNDQLSAFEMWLEFGTVTSSPPPQLPVVLQVLLSQSHRMRALQLLKKFLSLGNDAIRLSLILGIFPYILKLLQNPADDIKLTLISIWASVIGFDSSCRQELVREKSQLCFIQILGNKTISSSQRCLAAFVLSEVCNNYKEGQQSCLQLGLHRTCTTIISQPEVMNSSSLKLWVCLCLFKLCEDFLWAKYLCLTEAGHTALYPLLIDPDPVVRTAAVLALGELFGASALVKNANPSASTPGGSNYGGMSGGGGGGLSTPGSRPQMRKTLSSTSDDFASNMIVEEKVLEESELQLALQILECCTDGSVMVRLEAVYALSKFFIQSSHIDCIKLVAKEIYLKNIEKSKHNSGTNTNTTTGNTISGSMSMNVNLSGGGGGSMSAAKMLERRSTSPGLENNFGKVGLIYPWHLNPLESTEITNKLESLIKLQLHLDNNSNQSLNVDDVNAVPFVQLPPPAFTTPGSNNIKRDPLTESPDLMNTATGANNTTANTEGGGKSPTPDLATLMASAYVRLWLALTEVQGRDPHSLVAQAAATIRFRVHALISIDERNQYQQDRTRANSASSYQMTNSSMYSEALLAAAASGSYSPSTSATMNYLTSLQGTSQNNGNSTLNILEKRLKKSVTAESLMGGGDTGDHIHINTGDDLVPPSSSFDMMNTAPPLSPLGVVATSNTSYSSPKSMKARNVKFTANKLPKSSPFLTQPENQLVMDNNNNNYHHSSSMNNLHAYNTNTNVGIAGGTASGVNSRRNSRANKYFFLEAFKDYSHLTEDDLLICFSSNHYEIVKKNYMDGHNANSTTNSMISSYDPYQDPLSYESNQRSYRLQRLQEMLTNERILYEIFKDVEDRPEMMLERKNKQLLNEEQQHNNGLLGGGSGNSGGGGGSGSNTNAKNNIGGTSSSSNTLALSSLPHNSCKFEQKSTLRMDSPMTTSLIMFHAFQDILVVASESTANIWSLQSHHRIIEVKNRHTLKTSSPNGYEIGAHTPNRSTRLPQVTNVSSNNNSSSSNQENSLFAPVASSRITSMIWINESYDPLLLLGSDDGVIKIWRDVASTDTIQHHHQTYSSSNINNNNSNHSGSNINNESSGGGSPALGGNNNSHSNAANSIELATAFSALPDIAETSRGSGIVVSWQQTAGTLVVGGNSNTIRVWDVGREQNVRVFYTGVETCLTAMATNTVANGFTPTTNSLSDLSNYGDSSGYNSASQPVTWTFAGFADGSIAVYDERVHSNGGRVHFSHTHGTWVNYAHLRADVPEVVIGSVRGTVKFWDLRALRTYKTLEVQKSPLTSLTVHNLSPILAAGSHAQFIKILTLSGEQLGNVIKYYDGFLGQRIGPVSCLAFHPHKLLLGASSTDGIVSIYHAATDK